LSIPIEQSSWAKLLSEFRIERYTQQNRDQFDCGEDALNQYLKTRLTQDVKRRFATCYLLVENASNRIAGFYTLSAGGMDLSDIDEKRRKKLPRYPSVPMIRMGRLAIDKEFQGNKLGSVLVYDAVKRSAAADIGSYAVVVDAKDERAAEFYQRHGFIPLLSNRLILFLPITEAMRNLTR